MTTVNLGEPIILDGGRAIAFTFLAVGREARGQVSRDALEQYFWLQPAADESRMLKTFADGYPRIVAVACRLALRKGASLSASEHVRARVRDSRIGRV